MSSRKDSFKLLRISFFKIKSNQIIFNILVRAVEKNGSFGFSALG